MKVLTTKFSIQTTLEEDMTINECYEIVNNIMAQMASHNCDEMISDTTGEVITYSDFGRMLGILDGLPYMTTMYNTKK